MSNQAISGLLGRSSVTAPDESTLAEARGVGTSVAECSRWTSPWWPAALGPAWRVGRAPVPIVTWAAWPFHTATLRNLRSGTLSMDTLVSLGATVSFVWAIVVLIGSPAAAGYWIGFGPMPPGADAICLDVAAGMVTFQLGGRYCDSRSRRRASTGRAMRIRFSELRVTAVVVGQSLGTPQARSSGTSSCVPSSTFNPTPRSRFVVTGIPSMTMRPFAISSSARLSRG